MEVIFHGSPNLPRQELVPVLTPVGYEDMPCFRNLSRCGCIWSRYCPRLGACLPHIYSTRRLQRACPNITGHHEALRELAWRIVSPSPKPGHNLRRKSGAIARIPYTNGCCHHPGGSSVQYALSAAGGVLGFYQLGLASDRR